MNVLAELVSKIERVNYCNPTPMQCEDYARVKTAALVHAAKEIERLSEQPRVPTCPACGHTLDPSPGTQYSYWCNHCMAKTNPWKADLPHIAPITTKLAQVPSVESLKDPGVPLPMPQPVGTI